MLKIKILKILPYWLICLLIICAAQTAGAYFNLTSKKIPPEQSGMPQVLGESTSIRGQQLPQTEPPINQINGPDTSGVEAKSFLVFDLSTGQELLEKNSDQKFSIASLTKLLTGLVAYQNLDLNQDFTITGQDILKVSPDLDFTVGDSVKASDIFDSMIIGSCNDAALALGNYVSQVTGQNFVSLMNREAQSLGMQDSHFANPMGFDSPDNYSTAEDLKKLITATQQLAVFKNLGRRTDYQFSSNSGNIYSTVATDTLIKSHSDIQAIKTGYTNEAGGAMATKIDIGGREIVILVLDSANREEDTLKLKSIVSNSFEWN
jgi:serine-type D-Ala-D-Ala carboxypeptidase (penicillin-binding protein 5/6)